MRRLAEEGSEALRVRVTKAQAASLRKMAVGGKTVSRVVRDALERYLGGSELPPATPRIAKLAREVLRGNSPGAGAAVGGMKFPKEKWKRGKNRE